MPQRWFDELERRVERIAAEMRRRAEADDELRPHAGEHQSQAGEPETQEDRYDDDRG